MAEANMAQDEEEMALSSIYGDEFRIISREETEKIWELFIYPEESSSCFLILRIHLPNDYPGLRQPIFEIVCECLTGKGLEKLSESLDELWKENEGESIVYHWAERCREILTEENHVRLHKLHEEAAKQLEKTDETDSKLVIEEDIDVRNFKKEKLQKSSAKTENHQQVEEFEITSGEPIVDRKSTFQAHVACVTKEREVQLVMQKLRENRKIARASHNIMAYRIEGRQPGTFLQDNDDDGENEAGGRLMHLLQILDAKNVIVVVSRWYGGILLGPDRFKHINNCARDVIVNTGFSIPNQKTEAEHAGKKKQNKAKAKKK